MNTLIRQVMDRRQGLLFVVSGPSGAGKGTLVQQVLQRLSGLELSVSMTTRAPRAGEVEGVNYFFTTPADFERAIAQGQLLEYARYNGNYYGTPRGYVCDKTASGIDVILEIEVQGGAQVYHNMQDRVVRIFVLPPSEAALQQRLAGRNTETEASIRARLDRAQEEINHLPDYDYFVINDDLEQAVQATLSIIVAERHRVQISNNEEK